MMLMTANVETVKTLVDLLEYRKERFDAIARVFAAELSDSSAIAMVSNAQESLSADDDESAEGRLIKEIGAIAFEDAHEFATGLRTEYARLFIGPRRVLAPLHESAYRSGKSRMFTHDTLNVRAFYKAFGYEMVRKNLEPDDGISTEFEFLANLCERCIGLLDERLDEATVSELDRLLVAQSDFLRLHLLVWYEKFAEKVVEADECGFYGPWARYLVDVASEDEELLIECFDCVRSIRSENGIVKRGLK